MNCNFNRLLMGDRQPMVNTQNASRRKLHFQSLDDVLDDLDAIESADQQERLRVTGNWTAGQIMAHLAAWIEYGYNGFPIKSPPLPIRWLLRLMLPGILRKGMKRGVRIPGVTGGTTGADDGSTSQGIQRLRLAIERLRSEPAKFPSPAFGPMSEADRIRLQLRHAELHLSFIAIESDATS